jgi:hypothetical protein
MREAVMKEATYAPRTIRSGGAFRNWLLRSRKGKHSYIHARLARE